MNIKRLKNKLNNQKGVTGADVVIAMLIILTTLGVIGTVYVNLVIGSKETDRKTGATRIATNIFENIDMLYYDEIETNLDQLYDDGIATRNNTTYIIPGGENIKVFNTSIPKGYNLEINLENIPEQTIKENSFIKKITLKVTFKVDGIDKNVTLSKVIEREVVRECNSPKFTDEYVRQIISDGTDYIMYSESAIGVQEGVKIICPVQYDQKTKKYTIIEDTDKLWYSYSNKNWARLLVLESSELEDYIDSETKTITDLDILKSENSYVWIPRFGVEEGGELFGNTLFKYKNTDVAILNLYNDETEVVYNYVNIDNTTTWSTRGISFETDETLGKWSKYSDISTVNTDANKLNGSQYGPMIEY